MNETLFFQGSILRQGNRIEINGAHSNNFFLTLQSDGNLVMYRSGGGPIWASNVYGKGTPPYQLVFPSTGVLTVQDKTGASIWTLEQDKNSMNKQNIQDRPLYLAIQDTGNIQLFDNGRKLIWESGSGQYEQDVNTTGIYMCHEKKRSDEAIAYPLSTQGTAKLYKPGNCPDGWEKRNILGDIPTCYYGNYERSGGQQYPWKFGDVPFNYDGAKARCENDHGVGGCEMIGLIYYPKCTGWTENRPGDGTAWTCNAKKSCPPGYQFDRYDGVGTYCRPIQTGTVPFWENDYLKTVQKNMVYHDDGVVPAIVDTVSGWISKMK
jgi:hypothetical protein